MTHRKGFRIHYFLVIMAFAACATQVGNQESQEDSLDSAITTEICILPQHSYNTMAADFGMTHFTIQNDIDSLIPALKRQNENSSAVFTAVLPPVPDWMNDAHANDSLYRSAYRKYVKCFFDEYSRRGLHIQTLYIQKDSRESRFATIEELSTVVMCQFKQTNSLPGGNIPHQPWVVMEK